MRVKAIFLIDNYRGCAIISLTNRAAYYICTHMRKIPIDKIEPGMTLAKAVMSQSGMVLLSEGTELTEKWIERIQDMDLDSVYIDAPAEQTLSKEEAIAQLESRFKLVAKEPRMANIKSILRKHIEGLYG